MLEPMASTYLPFDTADAHAIRAAAAIDRTFHVLVARVLRVQFLQCAIASMLEPDEQAGLSALEDGLLLLIGAHQADGPCELHEKARVFRGRLSGRNDAIDAMLCASLEADFRRLGLLAEASADDAGGVRQ